MATGFTKGDKAGPLSAQAVKLYGAIAAQEWELVASLQTAHPDTWQELLNWGLISDEERPVVRDPQHALRTMVTCQLEQARWHIDLVASMPELSRDLIREYRQVQLRSGGSSEYLADGETANARLQDVVSGARTEILAAQPGGPRKRKILETAVTRDTAALDRGVTMRTIYRDTVRDHALTAEYARTMSTRTTGRPAQYRTLVDDFERMVIVDRQIAFVPNHIVEGADPHSAWMVTDPAVVAVLAAVFDATWRWAQPWMGELRPRARTGVDTVSGAGGARTNRRQRGVMRYLCSGESQAATARKLGVSRRKLQEEISVLKTLWGVGTLNELIYQYALSPDRLVDDSAGEAGLRGAVVPAA